MLSFSPTLPALCSEQLSLHYAREPLLENLPVFIFHGPSTTVNSTQNKSRIQAHIYSLAGFQTFPRLTIAPTSSLYAAVNHLPGDLQGDELYRGLAVALLSYFAALPHGTKTVLRELAGSRRSDKLAPMMFDEMHAGDLASRMLQLEDSGEVAAYLTSALARPSLSWVDVDVILPLGSIVRVARKEKELEMPVLDDNGLPLYEYGPYGSLMGSFGSPAFLPTSKLQRAPSRSTGNNMSRMLSKDQKMTLRREMRELVDTENSYVSKMRDLVDSVAADLRRDTASEIVDSLFPESLGKILSINEPFYQEIRAILEATESDAIRDFEQTSSHISLAFDPVTPGRRQDPTGAVHFARAILKWFPTFKEPYQEYLRASNKFSLLIAQALADKSSNLGSRLQMFGEQYLRSALIEPVQRLPRYSLLIENILNLLPPSHPALPNFVKARDILSDICALDMDESGHATRTSKALRSIVLDWPERLLLCGRLIAAVDIQELLPPHTLEDQCLAAILLLSPGKIVILRKMTQDALSARGLLAEVDHPSVLLSSVSSGLEHGTGLRLEKVYDLASLQITESVDGHLIYISELTSTPLLPHEALQLPTRVYSLQAPYRGKASRLMEEIVKARIEARYPEEVREGDKWALRSVESPEPGIGIMAAISETYQPQSLHDQYSLGRIRVLVDVRKSASSVTINDSASQIVACLTTSQSGTCELDTEGLDGAHFKDKCKDEHVVPLLRKRLEDLLRLHYRADRIPMAQQQASFESTILKAVPLRDHQRESRHKGFRPMSPIKLISNMLGVSASQSITPLKPHNRPPAIGIVPALPLPVASKDFVSSSCDHKDSSLSHEVALVGNSNDAIKSHLILLEDTFAAYIVALRSRSGNVVGKILQARACADELTVNELYNTLLEDPGRLEAAAIVSIDVLFAAFEKFLRRAWRERMGPLVAPNVIKDMQSNFDTGKPLQFTQHFRESLGEMSPQNKRAFATTVKLLSDLLDASGNDGDRGVLTASFAEAIILVGNPHDHIMLLDRLVEDYETLFDEVISPDGLGGSTVSATNSLGRTRSFNTGSLSSNASSLRKKLGLRGTLGRENSKNDPESKVASIWRTLSKNGKNPGDGSQFSSLSKASLVRSRSTDTDIRMLPPSRPVSRDRPPTSGSASLDGSHSRPGSSHLNMSALTSIGEDTPSKVSKLPRKKRRSSLSDLQPLRSPDLQAIIPPLQTLKETRNQFPEAQSKALPQTPSPRRTALAQQVDKRPPQRSGIPQFGSPRNKENLPSRDQPPSKESSPSVVHPQMNMPKSDTVTVSSYTPHKRNTSKSNIPVSRVGLSERTWPPNGANTAPSAQPSSAQKLRVQSPQKLRQRLSQEQRTANTTDGSLQAEMKKIGNELSALKRPGSSHQTPPSKATTNTDLQSLTSHLKSLETQLKSFTTGHAARAAALRSDLETSLVVSDRKARKLDDLYKEANAENEALYDRFNDELGKILARVRKGEGVEEMRAKLAEAQTDVGRLKGENAKLKREVLGLRSLLGGE